MATTEPSRLDFRHFVRPGDMVAWGQASGEPLTLTEMLMRQRRAIGAFRVFTGISYSATPDPQFTDSVEFFSYHGGASNRRLGELGRLGIIPCHYSQLPEILRSQIAVLLLHLSPPDSRGNFSLGVTHDYLVPLIDSARTIVAEINDQMPWIEGERTIAASEIDATIETSRPLLEAPARPPDGVDRAVAAKAASLIEDGATLQTGIGALPAAILAALGDRRHLAIHSGALVDPAVDLMESGAVEGTAVAGCLLGTQRLFDFAANNPRIAMRSIARTHDIGVLAALNKFTALNTAIEVDLTGQVNAEVADGQYIGAVGGAVDFIRGAHRSRGGLPIVALRSRAGGKSKIVKRLSGPVSTARADAGIVVTEHGVADLRRLSIEERIRRMIDIAHPDDREALERQGGD